MMKNLFNSDISLKGCYRKLLILVCGLFPLVSKAEYHEWIDIDNYQYITVSEDEVKLYGFLETPSKVIVPDTISYEGKIYKVTECYLEYNLYPDADNNLIKEIEFGNNIRTLEKVVLSGLRNLETVTFSASLEETGTGSIWISDCLNLQNIYVDPANPFLTSVDGILYNKDITSLIQVPMKRTQYEFHESVNSIGDYAFFQSAVRGNEGTMTVPSSIISFGKGAFQYCAYIERFEIDSEMENIPNSCFYGCSSLKSIRLPKNIKYLGSSAFAYCLSLESIQLPETVEQIGAYCFSGCSSLSRIGLTTNLNVIPEGCFKNCTGFYEFEIPASITSIGDYALYGMSNIRSFVLPENVIEFGKDNFSYWLSLENIELAPVFEISPYTFTYCPNLKNLTIPSSIKILNLTLFGNPDYYGNPYFYKDYSTLEEVILPASLEMFEGPSFRPCDCLKRIICYAQEPPVLDEESAYMPEDVFPEFVRFSAILYVPEDSIEKYRNSPVWKDFNNIRPLSEIAGVDIYPSQLPTGLRVFDLRGVNILNSDRMEDIESLKPGIYIINGKKTVIK